MKRELKNSEGSVTVEAAVILPIIISVILSFIFFIKLVHTHVTIQHAINDTANQIATYSYLYSAGGLQKIHDSTKESLEVKGSQAEKDIELVAESWEAFNEISGAMSENGVLGNTGYLREYLDNVGGTGNSSSQMLKGISELTKKVAANPKEEVLSIGSLLGSSLLEDGKTHVIQPVIGYMLCRNLEAGEYKDADTVLRKLSVDDGAEGLDLSGSTIFKDKKTVDIIVRYKIKLLLPVNILPDIYIAQRSTVRAWLDGDGQSWAGKGGDSSTTGNGSVSENSEGNEEQGNSSNDEADKKKTATVWDLQPKARGKILQTEQGRNLPDMFPTIAKLQNNTVCSIKSIDLTDVTYRKPVNLKYRINGFIKELSEFREGEYKGTKVQTKDYSFKTLVVIVPKDSLNASNRIILEECRRHAESQNITLTVIVHSQKKSEDK